MYRFCMQSSKKNIKIKLLNFEFKIESERQPKPLHCTKNFTPRNATSIHRNNEVGGNGQSDWS